MTYWNISDKIIGLLGNPSYTYAIEVYYFFSLLFLQVEVVNIDQLGLIAV